MWLNGSQNFPGMRLACDRPLDNEIAMSREFDRVVRRRILNEREQV